MKEVEDTHYRHSHIITYENVDIEKKEALFTDIGG